MLLMLHVYITEHKSGKVKVNQVCKITQCDSYVKDILREKSGADIADKPSLQRLINDLISLHMIKHWNSEK